MTVLSSSQKMKDDSDGDKKQQIHHIQNLYAFNLFCQKRFDDSMQVFAKLGTGESSLLSSRHLVPPCSRQINQSWIQLFHFLRVTPGYNLQ